MTKMTATEIAGRAAASRDALPAPASPAVSLIELSKVYVTGDVEVHALRSVSLNIKRGEMCAIMGASGSGKSTLMNIIGTLDRPTSGRYLLDDIPVEDLDEVALARLRNRKIGFVFQSFNLLPRHTALANVEVPLIYARVSPAERRRRAIAALTRVGLEGRLDHHPNQLSGGQQQRVAIARAIVTAPLILLADEPTGALDTEMTGQIMDLFCELHRGGMTVILVTHEPQVAAYAQRVIRFRDGRIVADEINPEPANATAPALDPAAVPPAPGAPV
jgi:putative ABC transport system ATP-binding protein